MIKKLAPWMLDWGITQAMTKLERAVLDDSCHPEHVLIAICDHFEPAWTGIPGASGQAPAFVGRQRVATWRERYPAFVANLRDSSGRPPRHTFFFPGDQYDPNLVEQLADLVSMGLADVEVHLHHDRDSRATLAEKLATTVDNLGRHGLVPLVRRQPRWAFIHGNWCLANARTDGAHCGVDDELDLLYQLGCYADFTFPSAPDSTQPRIVNRMYYPSGDVRQRRAHERGHAVRAGDGPQDRVFCLQGPLALSRRQGRGLPVRIDAGALTAKDPATLERFETWVRQRISVRDRQEWVFVKLSTHGASEREASSLLGGPQRRFHEGLSWYAKRAGFRYHYVTAREMFNIARAAMDGKVGDPSQYRDYEIPPAPRALPA